MITISNEAHTKITKHLAKRGSGLGIRIGVKTTGCSGLAYVLEYVDNPIDTDLALMQEGFTVYVDSKSSVYLKGMHIDYKKNGLNEGFEFSNPNARDHCGCGESFRI